MAAQARVQVSFVAEWIFFILDLRNSEMDKKGKYAICSFLRWVSPLGALENKR
jgi:hypothetical protein